MLALAQAEEAVESEPVNLHSVLTAAAARSQARPGISLSGLSSLYLVPGSVSSIIYVELSFVTRLISGWMEDIQDRHTITEWLSKPEK